ncbi:MAG: STAS domain-containing protein, partial [Aggregatilineales bacterium]
MMATIEMSRIGQITILTMNGRMDSINAARIQKSLMTLSQAERQQLILNMSGVSYISAAGLRILRNLQNEIGEVNIAAPSDRVVEVMQITGLDVVYTLHRTQIGAIHTKRPVLNA